MIGIYKITNTITGKSYIGQSVNVESRWKYHIKRCQNKYLSRAFIKYGVENFTFSILREVHETPLKFILLDSFEEYYIDKYKTLDRRFGNLIGHLFSPC
jgi:group I intron endonuclease